VSYAISAIADNQPTVYFRWVMGTTDTSVQYTGWNIDDLEISAVVTATPCPSDIDGDREVASGDLSLILLDFGACVGCPTDVDGDSEVTSSDLSLCLLDFGACP
jgi:hypothetical protein